MISNKISHQTDDIYILLNAKKVAFIVTSCAEGSVKNLNNKKKLGISLARFISLFLPPTSLIEVLYLMPFKSQCFIKHQDFVYTFLKICFYLHIYFMFLRVL